jgi:predicted dehydrogenase
MASGKLQVKNMITELVDLPDYEKIYGSMGKSNSIASILKYNTNGATAAANTIELKPGSYNSSNAVIGIIGAGNFTKMTLLPALKASGAAFKYIASEKGASGTALAKKYGFARSTTEYSEILRDEGVDLVMITTRHDKHATLTEEGLLYGKHVFVEKPLALTSGELDRIIAAYTESGKSLTVGFNRRFSPHAVKVKTLLGQGPLNVICTMNAGYIPDDFWVHDLKTGGGRIVGEACHYFDLITYFTGSRIIEVCMNALGKNPRANTDNASILLKYEDGSTGVINYFSNGAKTYPKERIEIYSQQRTAVIDNFQQTTGFGFRGFSRLRTSIDKGHKRQFAELISAIKTGGSPLIPINEIINTTKATFAAIESLKTNSWIKVE